MPESSDREESVRARKAGKKPVCRRLRRGVFMAFGSVFASCTKFSSVLGIVLTLAIGCPANAGDILRGGAPMSAAGGTASYGTNPAAVEQARANAKDALARTTQAVQAVQAMQTAARSLAVSRNNLGLDPNHAGLQLPNVPNGLGVGGLQVAPKVPVDLAHSVAGEDASLWTGANLPTQTVTNGKTDVTIKQTAQQALLNWQTFNIGSDTTLTFDQSAGGKNTSEWIAFNKINDPSGSPSQILGKMNAQGQVYVINQNGIIFGGASQINLHTLVASSLPINDNLISRGLLNNPDLQFLFSQLPIATISGGVMSAFNPSDPLTPNGKDGDVVVQSGAVLSSPTTPDHVGGRIALIGPNVKNAGIISTPDGQTILAAGNQVGLVAHTSNDPGLRGLDVFVGAGGGSAVNASGGLIDAARGNITIAGKDVAQLGIAQSTTSVSLNGSIDLLANYNTVRSVVDSKLQQYASASGSVLLGAKSVTEVLPEFSSDERVVGLQLALSSQINIQGEAIHLGKDSVILAPSANVSINAGNWLASTNGYLFVNSGGQIYLDDGALINVAGSTDVTAPISENIVSAQVRGAEVADSPLQRFGIFRGETIKLDTRQSGVFNGQAWIGTPLFNASGYLGLIQRTVSELTTAGGSVTLKAGESVVMQHGSKIDVSGGWINYQGGTVETTKILLNGHIYDISQATPDQIYDGIFTGSFTRNHAKFGISETFINPLLSGAHYENGYCYGANAGAVHITAPSVALDGSLLGRSVAGPRQRTIAPNPASFSLTFLNQDPSISVFPFISPTPPNIVFTKDASLKPADPFSLDASGKSVPLRADRKASVILSPDLVNADGFGLLNIDNSDGNITVPAGVILKLAAVTFINSDGTQQHSSIAFKAANADIEGSLTAPGGNLTFSIYDISPAVFDEISRASNNQQTPAPDPLRGHFTLGATASLSTAGIVVDDRPASSGQQSLPLVTNGGTIAINSYSANLVAGSLIDVSGGIAVGATGKQKFGDAGSITIKTGQDLQIAAVLGGQLVLGATLKGFSGSKGGTMNIQAPAIQIGGEIMNVKASQFTPDFFNEGGFANFSLTGLGAATSQSDQFLPAVSIAPGIVIAPKVQSFVAMQDPKNGNEIMLTPVLAPEGIRNPVSLSFNAPGVIDQYSRALVVRGELEIGTGVVIQTDAQTNPLRGVSLSGNTVAVLGSIIVPGGSISISGGSSYVTLSLNPQAFALPTVDLGPGSFLSTAGEVLLVPDMTGRGYRTGSVLGGGIITVSGNIVAESGAKLDVSGATGELDLALGYSFLNPTLHGSLNGAVLVPIQVDSNGGFITLKGAQELFCDASLIGSLGGAKALGGTLTISSGRFYPPGALLPTALDTTLLVTQNGPTIPESFYEAGQTAIGHAVKDKDGNPLQGLGYFAANSFLAGGFDSLTLKGTVEFSGPVNIEARGALRVADGGVIKADPTKSTIINLQAPYVKLGTPFQVPLAPENQPVSIFTIGTSPFYFAPTYGTGSLTVTADLIDIGSLSLQSIGLAKFNARNGDIRGDGTLDIAGDLFLNAGQIYPPTAVSFTIAVYDYSSGGLTHGGMVTIAGGGRQQLPLSAGGQLSIYASVINQGGVIRAPFGTINLGWDGSGSAPVDPIAGNTATIHATKTLTLATGSVTSVSGIDPVTREEIIVPYGTDLNGTSWIDPAGTDITLAGLANKAINLSAQNVAQKPGAVIDIRGGGDLYAYRWVSGLGGSKDVLASSSSFAVIPDYQSNFTPVDPGYFNSSLQVGDRVYLGKSDGLPAGMYTLLPARYALLPGAFLVTPRSGTPVGTVLQPEGSSIVSGYRINGLNASRVGQPLIASFEVASSAVVKSRAEYDTMFANSYFATSQPKDSGHLVLDATQSMSIRGLISSTSSAGGRGGLIDISSPVDILIAGRGVTAAPGLLVLDSSELSAFNAESLLIGGSRQTGPNGTTVTVKTDRIEVDNAGSPLTGSDIILTANTSLTLDPNAEILQSGNLSRSAETLLLGDSTKAGSGDGVLVRVSGDSSAQMIRSGIDLSTVPTLTIGAGARIAGVSVTLDSTSATSLDSSAKLTGNTVAINSGRISLQLNDPGSLQPTNGLVLSGLALQTLQNSINAFSLLSYSSIDVYGTGMVGGLDSNGIPTVGSLALHASEIRGFNNGGGTVTFAARNILLDNTSPGIVPGTVAGEPSGTLKFQAETIRLGANQFNVDQYATLALNASGEILEQGVGGFTTQGALELRAPLITGLTGANQTITANGAIIIQSPTGGASATVVGGLGAAITLVGASVTDNSDILLPSGQLTLRATNGNVVVGDVKVSRLDVGGNAKNFFDLVKYTDGGRISLISDNGNVNVFSGSVLNVAAKSGGGDAGSVNVSAQAGTSTILGVMLGSGGVGGKGGSFSLDVLGLPNLADIDATLNNAAFTLSRSFRVRTGDVLVDGVATAHSFNLSADQGAITVVGTIDASGATGGAVNIAAFGNVTLSDGGLVNAAGQDFDHAGKGGAVSLETTNGRISIETGSKIDLSVADNTAASASAGDFTGTLHLRAPQVATPDQVAIDPLAGSIVNASQIVIEGFFAQDANTTNEASIDDFKAAASSNAADFMANAQAIQTRLLGDNSAIADEFHVRPGEEIDNSKGDLVLNNDWDLSSWRFGAKKAAVDQSGNPLFDQSGNQIFSGVEPGILTLRAKGSITFNGSLSDGFGDGTGALDLPTDTNGSPALWLQKLLPRFADGSSQQSWSYRITSGADLAAVDFRRVSPLANLGATSGSILIGRDGGNNISNPFGSNAVVDTAINSPNGINHYQVIRTGAGDIDVSAGRSVMLLNQFATIYTAGTQTSDPTLGGSFDVPRTDAKLRLYAAQYSLGGGNVNITAQVDILHQTLDNFGVSIADSERELPANWLYRRGYVNANGQFGTSVLGDVASTTWWVDFTNFFEGVGALGGGNVTMIAGNNITNVDAVAPTNARMPKGTPDASKLVELGGGDLTVRAGNNIDGGVYYVERGNGILAAGNKITTNATRSASLGNIIIPSDIYPEQTWLPTSLFLGKGNFNITAGSDVLLGPVSNPFLLPQGSFNSYYYKTYFSTYAPTDVVNVSSLSGAVTLRESATMPGDTSPTPLLQAWLQNVQLLPASDVSVSYYQPWLRLAETSVDQFATVTTVMPATLIASSFSGDVNLIGNITLSPSPTGTVDLSAAGSINGLQPNGITTLAGKSFTEWGYSQIDLSDANPNSIPGFATPFAYQNAVGNNRNAGKTSNALDLSFIDRLFRETGSTLGAAGVMQTKQSLHGSPDGSGSLHFGDTNPVHLYAAVGDISGVTLFSGKAARVIAGRDITDIALYLQNDNEGDMSLVTSGRDIIASNPNSSLRGMALSAQNAFNVGTGALSGDIQISGPGTLEVLAGRNLDLGAGTTNSDGTGVGITSIGDGRNPYLPFEGANIIAAAGLGESTGLEASQLDFKSFIAKYITDPAQGARYFSELATVTGVNGGLTPQTFSQLPVEEQDIIALQVFYLVLRDAGRDHNNPASPGFGTYAAGLEAITALSPSIGIGDLTTQGRDIRTKSGGNISLLAPGGSLTLATSLIGNPLAPPGVITEDGGSILIYSGGSVNVGISRIFTLRGGNIVIWSNSGNIAAGASAKTVQSAPPTRVLVDPQSGDIKTDLAGLATGGGIGVLATVVGVPPGDVDLIAPAGAIDAGDAGIRVSGNLNLAAVQVLNTSNIQAGGASSGVPTTTVAAPNLGGMTAASTTAGAGANSAEEASKQQARTQQTQQEESPSIITVEVIGYGGGDDSAG